MGAELIFATIAYVIGIYCGSWITISFSVLLWLSFSAVCLVRRFLFRQKVWKIFWIVSVFTLGMVQYCWVSDLELQHLDVLEEKYVTLEGVISELPEKTPDGTAKCVLTTARTEYNKAEYPAGDRILVYTQDVPAFGEYVRVRGFLRRITDPKNTGEFDFARHYKAEGIYFRIYATELLKTGKRGTFWSLHYLVNGFKYRLTRQIDAQFTGDDAAILKAVLIGDKSALSEELETLCYQAGTMRYLYSPHLHMMIILSCINLLFGWLSKRKRDWLLIIGLVLYAVLRSSEPIFLKTCLLMAAGIWLKKQYGYLYPPDALSLVVLAVTMANPLYAFDTGFILSVAYSVLMYDIEDLVSGFCKGRYLWWQRLMAWCLAMVGLTPLCAYFFAGISPYGMLAGILYVPAVYLLMGSAVGFFGAVSLFGGGGVLGYPVSGLLLLLKKLPEAIRRLPFSYVRIPKPGIVVLLLIYLGILIIRWIRWRETKTHKTQLAISAFAGFLAVLFVSHASLLGKLNITFVNVGQGDGAILHIPFQQTVLIDGGGSAEHSGYDIGKRVFLPYLLRKGYYRIDLAVVSHYHKDHCQGILAAMGELQVQTLLLPDVEPDNLYRKQLEILAKQTGTRILYLEPGKIIQFDSGLELKVLAPDAVQRQSYEDINDTSLVIEVRFGEFRALFGGDMTAAVEERILADVEDCDLIKIPHHGSDTSSTTALIEKTAPELAVVSVGENNGYGLPDRAVLERYEKAGSRVLSTAELGDIHIITDKNGKMRVSAFLE